MKQEMITGGIGTAMSMISSVISPTEVLQIISMVIGIIGGLITFVIVPLITWYNNAKKDGKIDKEEAKEGAKTLIDGANKVAELTKKEEKDNAIKRD